MKKQTEKQIEEEMHIGAKEAARCQRMIQQARATHLASPRSILKAVRAYCIECSGGYRADVRKCIITDCPLYNFRMGKNQGPGAPRKAPSARQ